MSWFKKSAAKEIWQWGLLGGVAQGLYIFLVANFFQLLRGIFPKDPALWAPIIMLTFFVFSAAVSGLLVLGRPIFLVVRKDYKEAILTVLVSLGVLFLMLAAVIILAVL